MDFSSFYQLWFLISLPHLSLGLQMEEATKGLGWHVEATKGLAWQVEETIEGMGWQIEKDIEGLSW